MARCEAGVRISWRAAPGLLCVLLGAGVAGCDDHALICEDNDGDGYGSVCFDGTDCDDSDPEVHVVMIGYLDADGDGVTRSTASSLCTGGELPEGYLPVQVGADCNDSDPGLTRELVGYTDADGDGRGVGQSALVCSDRQLPDGFVSEAGDCDDADPAAFQTLQAFQDGDGDGVGAGSRQLICTGENLPGGYSEESGDCDDSNAERYREVVLFADQDGSGVGAGNGQVVCIGELVPEGFATSDGDCDDTALERYQVLTGYRDVDGDNVGAGEAVRLCSGDALPEGYVGSGGDCDDNRVEAYRELEGFFDNDGDGRGGGDPQRFCTGATLPEGVVTSGGDCDDRSAARYQMLSGHIDADGDGRGAGASQLVCSGDALPAGFATTGEDCDDADAARYQLLSGYADNDGDGMGVGARQTLCGGESLPDGFAAVAGDCDDSDDDAFELVSGYTDNDGDGFGVGALREVCSDGSLGGALAEEAGDCNDRDGDVYQLLPGYPDGDGDGFGVGTLLDVCSGDELPAGYATLVGDCDDLDAAVFERMAAFFDGDEDGVGVGDLLDLCTDGVLPAGFAEVAVDCDDEDETVYHELHGYNDNDADGVGGGDAVTVCTGDALPAGLVEGGGDCDDEDFDNDASCLTCLDPDGDGFFNECDRFVVRSGPDCDPINRRAWRVVDVFRDRDGDGATVGEAHRMCVGEDIPEPFIEEASDEEDCNDWDDTISVATDIFQDADGDTYTDGPALTMCLGGDVPDFFTTTSAGEDCDDYDSDVYQLLPGFPDTDEDGFTLEAVVEVCSGDALPVGYLDAVSGEIDCDDIDPFVNPGVTEDPPGDLTDHDCDGVFPLPVTGDGIFVDGNFFIDGDVTGAGNGNGVLCPEDDEDLGGIANPLSDIHQGIFYAEACDRDAVFIAASGDDDSYGEDPLETTVSLYGGFREGFTVQDLLLPTVVEVPAESGEPVLAVPAGAEVSIVGLTLNFRTFFTDPEPVSANSVLDEAFILFYNSGDTALRHSVVELLDQFVFVDGPSYFGVVNTPFGTLFAADNTIDLHPEVIDGDVGEGTGLHTHGTALRNDGTLTAIRNALMGGYSIHDDSLDAIFFGGLGVDNTGSAVLRGNVISRGTQCCFSDFCSGDGELMFTAAVHNGENADMWLADNVFPGAFPGNSCNSDELTAIGGVANEGSAWIRDNEIHGGFGGPDAALAVGIYNLSSAVITGNTIVGGEDLESISIGIFNAGGGATIAHNPSIVGTPPSEDEVQIPEDVFGIVNAATALIGGNTVVGGRPDGDDTAVGIVNTTDFIGSLMPAPTATTIGYLFDNDITGLVGGTFVGGFGILSEAGATLLAVRNRILGGLPPSEGCCRDLTGVFLRNTQSTTLWFNTISGGLTDDEGIGVLAEGTQGPTLIEYNEIVGGQGDDVTGIDVFDSAADFVIRENTIEGGVSTEDEAEGVDLFHARAIIDQNLIVGGTGEERCPGVELSHGIYDLRGNDITGCVLGAEQENEQGIGIWVVDDEGALASTVTVEGNTIDGGVAECVAGIIADGSITVTDNVITGGTGLELAVGVGFGRLPCFDDLAQFPSVLGSTVSGNVIQAGTSGLITAGAWLEQGFHELTNNFIHGGEAVPFGCCSSSASAGVIQEPNAFAFAVNNTIYGGRSVHVEDEVLGSFGFWFNSELVDGFPDPDVGDDESVVATFLINNIIDPGWAEGGSHSVALFMENAWSLFLSHNDLWGERMTHLVVNFPGSDEDPVEDPPVVVGNSEDLNACGWLGCYLAEGNISEDPLFVGPAFGDFHVDGDSPVIDAAVNPTPDGVPVTRDGDWDPRPFGLFDIGADELVPEL